MKTLLFTLLTLAAFQAGVFAKIQPAEAATFDYAYDIGTDNEGNVYVLDLKKDGRRTICKYNSTENRSLRWPASKTKKFAHLP